MNASRVRRPSVPYYFGMAAAMVGMVCLAVAIQGTRLAAQGHDGLGAFNQAGVPALVVAWGLALYARLAFGERVAPATQSLVRVSLRILFAIEILVALAGSWFVFGSPAATSDLRGIMVVGDLLQIGTLLWVVRYAAE